MRKLLLTLQYYLCLLVALLTASLSYAQNDKKTFQISGKRPAYGTARNQPAVIEAAEEQDPAVLYGVKQAAEILI